MASPTRTKASKLIGRRPNVSRRPSKSQVDFRKPGKRLLNLANSRPLSSKSQVLLSEVKQTFGL